MPDDKCSKNKIETAIKINERQQFLTLKKRKKSDSEIPLSMNETA